MPANRNTLAWRRRIAALALLALAVAAGAWIRERTTHSDRPQAIASPPEKPVRIDESAAQLREFAINGQDARSGDLAKRIDAATPITLAGTLTSDPARWIWSPDGIRAYTPATAKNDPWFEKHKDKTYPMLAFSWWRVSSDAPGGILEKQWTTIELGRRRDGSMKFQLERLPPQSAGTYELQVSLKEVSAYGDTMFPPVREHLLFTTRVDVVAVSSEAVSADRR